MKGKESFDCSDTLYNIGLLYNNQGNLNEALAYYCRVQAIYENSEIQESSQHAIILKSIDDVYERLLEV